MDHGVLTMGSRPAGESAVLRTVLRRRLEKVRRYRWLVGLVTLLAVAATAFLSLSTGPTYTGKSALVVSSPGRTPEQDAVLAVGYAMLFNDPVTIARLRAARAIPEDVGLEARTAAASPIVTVEATTHSPQSAQDTAELMAETFRDDINAERQQDADATVADLQRQIDEIRARPQPGGVVDPAVGALQESIDNVQFYSTTDQLRELQMRVGVVKNSRHTVMKSLLALAGGLMAGIFAAFALGALSNRLTNAGDVREKTGIEPLVELPARTSRRSGLREERLRALFKTIYARSAAGPLVLAVTDTPGVGGAQQVAEALADLSAQQGLRTILVLTDSDVETEQSGWPGFQDVLWDSRVVGAVLQHCALETLTILTAGSPDGDGHTPLTRARLDAVLEQMRAGVDIVIFSAPAISDTAQAEIICAAADVTILVISKAVSRVDDVLAADKTLAAVGATVAGAVLLDGKSSGARPIPTRTGSAARHRSWVAEAVQA